MRSILQHALFTAAWATTFSLHAEVRLPALLTDHMVLQQQAESFTKKEDPAPWCPLLGPIPHLVRVSKYECTKLQTELS